MRVVVRQGFYCTADNGFYVATVKKIMGKADPPNEANEVTALEGVKISDHDSRTAHAIAITVVELTQEQAATEENVDDAVLQAIQDTQAAPSQRQRRRQTTSLAVTTEEDIPKRNPGAEYPHLGPTLSLMWNRTKTPSHNL